MTDPTRRPTKDTRPDQWTREDLQLAAERGEHDRIVAARKAGALEDVMHSPSPQGPRSVKQNRANR